MIWNKEFTELIDLSSYPIVPFDDSENGITANNIIKAEEEINLALLNSKRCQIEKIALQIVLNNIADFMGYEVITIKVEDYFCVAKITDEWKPLEISSVVYPFDENKTYPIQEIEHKYAFKRY